MNRPVIFTALFAGTVFFFSCKDTPSKNHGPIVLGDSSTIVTETDESKLQDMVTSLQPVITPSEEPKDTPAAQQPQAAADTTPKEKPVVKEEPAQQPAAPTGNGLTATFKETTVLLPGVSAKIAGRTNLERANGAVYTWQSGNVNGNSLKISGNITKVSQRYQSVIVLKSNMGTIPVETLNTTSDWVPLKGGKGVWRISGLDAGSLEYPEANANLIRSAVTRAAQRRRMSKKKIQELLATIRNVKSTNQKPLSVTLRSVMWKIDGKDANGRNFSKQIRMDFPL